MPLISTQPPSQCDRIVERLRRARTTTETSVLAIGKLLSEIVDVATEDVATVKQCLGISTSEEDDQSSNVTQAIRVQSRLINSYVDEMHSFIQRQIAFSEAANQAFNLIAECSAGVSKLAEMSHLLALNLRIEAGRLGARGAAVSAVGCEMTQFSVNVRDANENIVKAMDDLKHSLPQIRTEMSQMETRTTEFSNQLDAKLNEIECHAQQLDDSLKESLNRAETKNESILKHSLTTLSELQFQDPVGQELQKIEQEVLSLQNLLGQHGLDSSDQFDCLEEVNPAEVHALSNGEVVLF